MGLYVSTTGTDVEIPELGFTLTHPSTDYALSGQFSPEDLRGAPSLTDHIRSGMLIWKKTLGGAVQTATDYDPDFVDVENENQGTGSKMDRVVTFKDMLLPKSGKLLATDFSGTPKKAAVTFLTAYPDSSYSIQVSGVDARIWTFETQSASGFIINANANQVLTGVVCWDTTYNGEA